MRIAYFPYYIWVFPIHPPTFQLYIVASHLQGAPCWGGVRTYVEGLIVVFPHCSEASNLGFLLLSLTLCHSLKRITSQNQLWRWTATIFKIGPITPILLHLLACNCCCMWHFFFVETVWKVTGPHIWENPNARSIYCPYILPYVKSPSKMGDSDSESH